MFHITFSQNKGQNLRIFEIHCKDNWKRISYIYIYGYSVFYFGIYQVSKMMDNFKIKIVHKSSCFYLYSYYYTDLVIVPRQ